MHTNKYYIIVIWEAFLFLTYPLVGSELETSIMSPEKFKQTVSELCRDQKVDDFFDFVTSFDHTMMNSVLDTSTESGGSYKAQNLTALAEALYPRDSILKTSALAFHELPVTTRYCLLLSARYGHPVAERIIKFENATGEYEDIVLDEHFINAQIEQGESTVEVLSKLLETPFLWNNISAMNTLRKDDNFEILRDIANESLQKSALSGPQNIYILLNSFFVAEERSSDDNFVTSVEGKKAIKWLQAIYSNCTLAAIQLHRLGELIDNSHKAKVEADDERYGRDDQQIDRKAALAVYERQAQELKSSERYMELAEFYKDLFEASAWTEVELREQDIKNKIFLYLINAHDRGESAAAETAISFISELRSKNPAETIYMPDNKEKSLNEATVFFNELAYLRTCDETYLEGIRQVDHGYNAKVLEFKAIKQKSFRESLISWSLNR